MASRNRRGSHDLRAILGIWALIFVFILLETTLRAIGWITATAIIAAAAYFMGRRSMVRIARKHAKLNGNAAYGKPGEPARYLGGSYPREPGMVKDEFGVWTPGGPVTETDVVSAYPPKYQYDDDGVPYKPANNVSDIRSRVLRDPRSGTRPLFRSDENGPDES